MIFAVPAESFHQRNVEGLLLKFIHRGHIIGLHKRAVTVVACQLGTAFKDIVISRAVCRSGVLFEKSEVCKEIGVDAYR